MKLDFHSLLLVVAAVILAAAIYFNFFTGPVVFK